SVTMPKTVASWVCDQEIVENKANKEANSTHGLYAGQSVSATALLIILADTSTGATISTLAAKARNSVQDSLKALTPIVLLPCGACKDTMNAICRPFRQNSAETRVANLGRDCRSYRVQQVLATNRLGQEALRAQF